MYIIPTPLTHSITTKIYNWTHYITTIMHYSKCTLFTPKIMYKTKIKYILQSMYFMLLIQLYHGLILVESIVHKFLVLICCFNIPPPYPNLDRVFHHWKFELRFQHLLLNGIVQFLYRCQSSCFLYGNNGVWYATMLFWCYFLLYFSCFYHIKGNYIIALKTLKCLKIDLNCIYRL